MGRRRKTPRDRTRVFVVQDKSGSMSNRTAETISGFNEYLDNIEDEGEVLISLIQFDTTVDNVFINRPLDEVEDLTKADFITGGMTALRDGVGRAISTAELSAGADDKVLIVIMTDGGENSSREYSHNAILSQIKNKRKDGWEFVFMGAGEEAWNAGQQVFGGSIPHTHTLNYGMDGHSHRASYAALAGTTNSVLRSAKGQGLGFDVKVKARLEDKAKRELAHR